MSNAEVKARPAESPGLSRHSVLVLVAQLLIIAAACICSYYLTREFRIIPRSILQLPSVYVGFDDLALIIRIFVTTTLVQIVLLSWRLRSHALANPLRFANEYVAYLVSWTTAALYIFLATTINYDPQLMAAIGILSTAGYLALFLISTAIAANGPTLPAFFSAIGNIVKRLLSPVGVLVILYFLTPLALGVAFTKNRDVANVITQVRIALNPVPASDFGFRSFLPGQVFEQPVQVLQSPADNQILYVLERVGRVLAVDRTGAKQPELLLDISARLGAIEVENGALGMVLAPNTASSAGAGLPQYLYLYYTDTRPKEGQINRLSRFDLSATTAKRRTASETPLMTLYREGSGFHNGGGLAFGPDGYLYIAVGEGVRTPENKTSAEALRAGILRIDVSEDRTRGLDIEPFSFGELAGYRVPKDNPFIDNPKVRNEYWALGLRNPFRISFSSESGALWVGDVGSTVWEEVNLIREGRHYGFPVVEGRETTGKRGSESLGIPYEEPIYTYVHDAYDRAIIGGIVVAGDRYAALSGQYVFADNYSSKLLAIPTGSPVVAEATLLARANQYAQRGVSSVTQLPSGEILVTTLGAASQPSGEVLELVPAAQAKTAVPDALASSEVELVVSRAEAETLYRSNCSRCHGAEADGRGPDADDLGVPMPNFTNEAYFNVAGRDYLRAVIAKGGAANGISALMPPWENVLQPEELEALLDYLESLPDAQQ